MSTEKIDKEETKDEASQQSQSGFLSSLIRTLGWTAAIVLALGGIVSLSFLSDFVKNYTQVDEVQTPAPEPLDVQ